MDRGPAIFLMVVPLLLVADLPEPDGKELSIALLRQRIQAGNG